MTKQNALREIPGGIRNCFHEKDLFFIADASCHGNADGLKFLARRWELKRGEIWREIYPVIKHWLDNDHAARSESQPWRDDPELRRLKATQMATDAAWHFADK